MVNTETNTESASYKKNCEPQNYVITPDLNIDKNLWSTLPEYVSVNAKIVTGATGLPPACRR